MEGVDFSKAPMTYDESRQLTYTGPGVLIVQLKCFVSPPTPAEYRTCPECEITHEVASQKSLEIAVPDEICRSDSGQLVLFLQNFSGEREEIHILVSESILVDPSTESGGAVEQGGAAAAGE